MLSHLVYLFGDKFAPETNIFHLQETLLNGKKVDQKKLAQQLIFSALVSLYQDSLIDIFLEEQKIFFLKTTNIKAKRIKEAKDLEGLEKQLFSQIKTVERLTDIVRLSVHIDENPWQRVTRMARKIAEETKVKDSEIEKMFNAYSITIKEIKTKGELFTKIHEAIKEGIERREEKEESSE